ncbi:tryptophan 7-halogenase [uncultured Celeribacter sp.]|uniref:tryptophan 7-halogenase n=1 Tax=uncultured Celeribacter sp. TaxID=1303376 RepID=UPI003748A856
MTSIALIGGGLAGKLAALYFSRSIPDARISIIDPEREGLPIVGESTVEVTVQFLKSLGLGDYLEEEHLHKYGLTYYFRLPSGGRLITTPSMYSTRHLGSFAYHPIT